jgi:predicted RNA-binding protein associated with RNAse of E/G family
MQVIKKDAYGKIKWRYEAEPVQWGDGWLLLQAYFDIDDRHDGYFQWQKGDLFHEWYFADRWYNINKIYDRETGALRGWYVNITRPSRWDEHTLEWEDLELDIFVYPDGDLILKDEEAFSALNISREDHDAAIAAMHEIFTMATQGLPPFDS